MDVVLVVEQALNGIQLGILLFLLAAGLTLILGIMDFVNLAHGSLYMVGAFLVATFVKWTGNFGIAILLAVPATLVVGIVVEIVTLRTLYQRSHLDQVLATFGLLLFFNEAVHLIWGPEGMSIALPGILDFALQLPGGINYPAYRMLIIVVGLAVALGLYLLVSWTRIGMLIRAGASNRTMISALGVDIKLLFTLVFGLGAALAGLAGMLYVPIGQAQIGMGELILINAFVVIVIGGIGSIRGAFIASLLTGMIDTLGRAFLEDFLGLFMTVNAAQTAGPALSAMMIYFLMAAVLAVRPQGLFPPRSR